MIQVVRGVVKAVESPLRVAAWRADVYKTARCHIVYRRAPHISTSHVVRIYLGIRSVVTVILNDIDHHEYKTPTASHSPRLHTVPAT